MRSAIAGLAIFALVLSGCGAPEVVGGGIIGGAILKQKVSDLLSEARAQGAALIAQGGDKANALLINAGNELNVQADNAARALGSEAGKTVEQVGAHYQPVVATLLETMQNGKRLKDEAYQFKNAAVIDVHTLIATWPVIGNAFLVKAISGTSMVIKKEANYKLSIQGVGLGIASSRIKSSTRLLINKKPLEINPESPDDQTAMFSIPNATLAPFFQNEKLVLVPAAFEISQEIHPWYGIGTTTHKYTVPVTLALIPRRAASVKIVRTFDQYDWKLVRSETKDSTSGDHNCPKCSDPPHAPYTSQIEVPNAKKISPVPGDQQLRNAVLACIGGACPWSSITSVNLQDNASRALASWLVWGSPVTYRLKADVYEYAPTGSRGQEEQVLTAYFDTPFELQIPKAASSSTLAYYTTYNKEQDYLVAGKNLDLFQLESQTTSDAKDIYIYRIRRPD